MRVALDTNIMAYAEGIGDVHMQELASDVILKLPPESTVLPLQTLGELYNVLTWKGGRSREAARTAIFKWRDGYPVIETSTAILVRATDHRLTIWDAIIVCAAAQAGCRLLLSEDLQDGFTWNGLTVTNPFASPRHILLEALIGDAPQ